MKNPFIFLLCCLFLFSCKSVPEKVKENINKYVETGKQLSAPVDINNPAGIYEQAKSVNIESKMQYLDVDKIETVYGKGSSGQDQLDSIVRFSKDNYQILYDFSTTGKTADSIKKLSNLSDFEKLAERLYMGKQ